MTTSLKLKEKTKKRLKAIAKKMDATPHSLMVAAIEEFIAETEWHQSLLADAQKAADDIDAGGPVYDGKEVHAYILGMTKDKRPKRPETC